MKVEAQGKEAIIRNSNGDIAIIPIKHVREVTDMIKDGCHGCIDRYVSQLPKADNYAEDGTIIQEKKNIEDEYVEFNKKKISKRFYPHVEKIFNEINEEAKKQGFTAVITDGYRTLEGQKKINKAYTQSPVSLHNFGDAVDIAFINNKTKKVDYTQKKLYEKLGEIAQREGMTWGGTWKGLPDVPHIQYYKNSAEGIRQNESRRSIYMENLDYYKNLLIEQEKKKEDTENLKDLISELEKSNQKVSIPNNVDAITR